MIVFGVGASDGTVEIDRVPMNNGGSDGLRPDARKLWFSKVRSRIPPDGERTRTAQRVARLALVELLIWAEQAFSARPFGR
jgi:hypothetical protein